MILQRSLFRPMVDLLEDRNAPGEVFGLTALPISLLSSFNNTDAPPQASFRQGQPQAKAVASVRFQALLSDLNTPFLGNDDQQPSQSSNLRISSQATESNQGLKSNLIDFYTPFIGLPVSATSTSNNGTSKYSIASWEAPDHQASVASTALFDVAGSYLASTVFATFIEALDDKASLDAVVNNQIEQSITLRSPTLNGSISIACTTTTGANPGVLSGADKISPGWLSNVNWSADWNGNGWNPTSTKIDSAGLSSNYTPDKDLSIVSGGITGGDPDLRKFVVTVGKGGNVLPNVNWDFKLTFGDKVRVYKDVNTKIAAPIATGDTFSPTEGGPGDKSMTFYLEGITASTAFRDVELKAEYVGNDITMNSYTDTVKVSVIGVTQTGIFSGNQQNDYYDRFSFYRVSYDENGRISWDLQKYMDLALPVAQGGAGIEYCQYFANCMEMQGTVSPPRTSYVDIYYGAANDPRYPEYNNGGYPAGLLSFRQSREKYQQSWYYNTSTDSLNPAYTDTAFKWTSDNELRPTNPNENNGESSNPSYDNHIYYNDGPGWKSQTAPNDVKYIQQYKNFRNLVEVNIYGLSFQCSDFAKWHSQLLIKRTLGDLLVRANIEYITPAAGWMNIAMRSDQANW